MWERVLQKQTSGSALSLYVEIRRPTALSSYAPRSEDNLHSSPYVIKMMKRRRITWTRHVARMVKRFVRSSVGGSGNKWSEGLDKLEKSFTSSGLPVCTFLLLMLHNHVPGSYLDYGIIVSVNCQKMALGSFTLCHDRVYSRAWVAQSV